MPISLYEQVKDEIPDHVGVWCGSVIKKPKKVEPSVPTEVLMKSMVRSLFREADRYMMAIFEKDTPENRRLQKERKKNKETIGKLRNEIKLLQMYLSMAKGSPVVDLKERTRSVDFYRKLFQESRDEIRGLRDEITRLRARNE
jgi:hypothetical protein